VVVLSGNRAPREKEDMHDTAYEIGGEFFNTYVRDSARVLEIGSQNVNGTLRDFAPVNSEYIGVDICPGPGVDIVLEDPYTFPFKGGQFDAVISSSCFEHDQLFWLTFLEMVRVAKPRGYIYINAPSNGNYHRLPVDNWRFYPDAALALQCWARRQGKAVKLIECFTARRKQDIWNDCVMIFSKRKHSRSKDDPRLADKFPGSFNVRSWLSPKVENLCEETEDRLLFQQADDTVEQYKAHIASTAGERDEAVAALALARGELAALQGSCTEIEQSNGLLKAAVAQREAETASIAGERDQTIAALALAREELAASRAFCAEIEQSNGLLKAAVAEREASLRIAEQQSLENSTLLESMGRTIASARAALADATQESRDHITAREAMEAEIHSLRSALALAQRDARERAEAAEAMRDEIASLQGRLAAARELGSVAMTALKTAPVAAKEQPRGSRHWRNAHSASGRGLR
jgi:SAM-dependent methyltransferase